MAVSTALVGLGLTAVGESAGRRGAAPAARHASRVPKPAGRPRRSLGSEASSRLQDASCPAVHASRLLPAQLQRVAGTRREGGPRPAQHPPTLPDAALRAAKLRLATVVQYLPLPAVGGYLSYVGYFCFASGLGLGCGIQLGTLASWAQLWDVQVGWCRGQHLRAALAVGPLPGAPQRSSWWVSRRASGRANAGAAPVPRAPRARPAAARRCRGVPQGTPRHHRLAPSLPRPAARSRCACCPRWAPAPR